MHQELAGYYYYIPTESEIANGIIPEINQMLGKNEEVGGSPMHITQNRAIKEDGIKTVIIRLIDKAGNVSAPSTIEVKVDNTEPIISWVEVKEEDIAGDGFVITAQATDQPVDDPLSKELTYYYYVQEVGIIERSLIKETKEARCMVDKLKPETEYIVYVEVKDEAGNIAKDKEEAIFKVTTKEEGTTINPGENRWNRRKPEDQGQEETGGTGTGKSFVTIEVAPKAGVTRLDSGWYTGNVDVTIKCIAEEAQNIKYTVTRGGTQEKASSEEGNEGPITFEVSNEGITKIEAWTIDGEGKETPKKIITVRIDKFDPEKPYLTVVKEGNIDITNNPEKWLNAKGKILVEAGAENREIGLSIAKIEYEITKVGGTARVDSKSGQIVEILASELGTDGTYNIKAWAVDEAGRKSKEYIEVTIGKDTVAPTNASLTVKTEMSKTIAVEAKAKDNGGSGIYTYEFKYKTVGSGSYSTVDIITVANEETLKYSYRGLTTGVSYGLLVEITDKAGNKVATAADIYGTTKEWVARIGDYVTYTHYNKESTEVSAKSSGYSANQTIKRIPDSNAKWRIWEIDEEQGKLVLISYAALDSLQLRGAVGYNNGVKILNDVCSDLYSYTVTSKDGTIKQLVNARSLRFSDINKVLRTPFTYKTITANIKEELHYFPNIFLKEKGSSFSKEQNLFEFTNELGPEEQYSWVQGTYQTIDGSCFPTMTTVDFVDGYGEIKEYNWNAPEYREMLSTQKIMVFLGTRASYIWSGQPWWGILIMNNSIEMLITDLIRQ